MACYGISHLLFCTASFQYPSDILQETESAGNGFHLISHRPCLNADYYEFNLLLSVVLRVVIGHLYNWIVINMCSIEVKMIEMIIGNPVKKIFNSRFSKFLIRGFRVLIREPRMKISLHIKRLNSISLGGVLDLFQFRPIIFTLSLFFPLLE